MRGRAYLPLWESLIKDHHADFERFLHYYGEPYARLDRTEGAMELKKTHSTIFRILTPLLFYQPDVYFEDLKKVYPDQTVHYYGWRKFVTELKDEWEKSLIPVRATGLFAPVQSSHRYYRPLCCSLQMWGFSQYRVSTTLQAAVHGASHRSHVMLPRFSALSIM